LEKIGENFHLIDTLGLGTRRTIASYLVEGEVSALVDMGYASSAAQIERELSQSGKETTLRLLVPTHVHLDHAGSVGTLAQKFPGCKIVVQNRGAVHITDPARLVQSATTVFGPELMKRMGGMEPVSLDRVVPAADSDVLELGAGLRLQIFWAPGHAPHQMVLFEPSSRTLITADSVGLRYPDVPIVIPTTPPPAFDPNIAIQTLGMVLKLKPNLLLMPHFGIETDVENSIQTNIDRLKEWKDLATRIMSNGGDVDALYGSFVNWVAVESRVPVSSLPDYLKLSMRVNAQGFWHYFDRLRRTQLRPQ
jgi:glyoxylase-like metal-dependent hydrolase (beta-lactamase superfamily II)